MFKAETKFNKHFEVATSEKQARKQAEKKMIVIHDIIEILK